MAISHEFDPAKGFVALPSDVMDIDMTPGAFRLLVGLCRMANTTGECWPSLAQLSDRIGRSKASISGYISELRNLDLLNTTSQKMANGYNYRLKYCVTFWQNWRAQLSNMRQSKATPKSKCSVQPIERRVNSKNHSHKNHTPACNAEKKQPSAKLVSVFLNWSALSKGAVFPNFNRPVNNTLASETQELLEQYATDISTKRQIENHLGKLWLALNVAITPNELTLQTTNLFNKRISTAGLIAFTKAVQTTWQNHWRKPPNEEQFMQLFVQSQAYNQEEGMLRMLEQFLKRWNMVQKKLQHRTPSLNLAA
jgi:hypothetical protein